MTATNLTQRIFVPVDGSEASLAALPLAALLAGEGGEIILLRVLPPPPMLRDPLSRRGVSSKRAINTYRQIASDELEQIVQDLTAQGHHVVTILDTGDPAEVILRTSAERDANMIVMSSAGRGAFGRLTFGSVADRVSRQATIPVLVTHPGDQGATPGDVAIERIVVPLDGSPLSLAALPVAAALGSQLGVPITLLSVVDAEGSSSVGLVYASAFSNEIYEQLLADEQADAATSLERLAADLRMPGQAVTCQVLSGPTAKVISGNTRPGDLIVMTSHGRSGMQRWLIGSVAEKLLRQAPGPVIVVHADAAATES